MLFNLEKVHGGKYATRTISTLVYHIYIYKKALSQNDKAFLFQVSKGTVLYYIIELPCVNRQL